MRARRTLAKGSTEATWVLEHSLSTQRWTISVKISAEMSLICSVAAKKPSQDNLRDEMTATVDGYHAEDSSDLLTFSITAPSNPSYHADAT